MPGSHVVAILGRPLRADYCRAFLASRPAGDTLVAIVPTADSLDRPRQGTQLVVAPIDEGHGLISSTGQRARGNMLKWMRSGSTGGIRTEKLIRATRDTLRRMFSRRIMEVVEPYWSDGGGSGPWAQGRVTSLLESIHARNPIDLIAVFDVFTLAEALEFASHNESEVVVR
jgi:hypothetical protein